MTDERLKELLGPHQSFRLLEQGSAGRWVGAGTILRVERAMNPDVFARFRERCRAEARERWPWR